MKKVIYLPFEAGGNARFRLTFIVTKTQVTKDGVLVLNKKGLPKQVDETTCEVATPDGEGWQPLAAATVRPHPMDRPSASTARTAALKKALRKSAARGLVLQLWFDRLKELSRARRQIWAKAMAEYQAGLRKAKEEVEVAS